MSEFLQETNKQEFSRSSLLAKTGSILRDMTASLGLQNGSKKKDETTTNNSFEKKNQVYTNVHGTHVGTPSASSPSRHSTPSNNGKNEFASHGGYIDLPHSATAAITSDTKVMSTFGTPRISRLQISEENNESSLKTNSPHRDTISTSNNVSINNLQELVGIENEEEKTASNVITSTVLDLAPPLPSLKLTPWHPSVIIPSRLDTDEVFFLLLHSFCRDLTTLDDALRRDGVILNNKVAGARIAWNDAKVAADIAISARDKKRIDVDSRAEKKEKLQMDLHSQMTKSGGNSAYLRTASIAIGEADSQLREAAAEWRTIAWEATLATTREQELREVSDALVAQLIDLTAAATSDKNSLIMHIWMALTNAWQEQVSNEH
jgi:hypothetical protein